MKRIQTYYDSSAKRIQKYVVHFSCYLLYHRVFFYVRNQKNYMLATGLFANVLSHSSLAPPSSSRHHSKYGHHHAGHGRRHSGSHTGKWVAVLVLILTVAGIAGFCIWYFVLRHTCKGKCKSRCDWKSLAPSLEIANTYGAGPFLLNENITPIACKEAYPTPQAIEAGKGDGVCCVVAESDDPTFTSTHDRTACTHACASICRGFNKQGVSVRGATCGCTDIHNNHCSPLSCTGVCYVAQCLCGGSITE